MIAQTNEKARETAVMIADRILKSTTYDFVDKKSGKTYTSLKNVPLNKNVKVQSKYLDWHYTNGVTNIALMELGDRLGTSKYENYVLKNMNFIFDDANQDYFHRLYDQTLEQEGWRAVNHVNWHMIYRNKRLDDNGPMGASLIVLNRRHPEQAFQKYIDQTDHHLMVSEPRLADGTIARLWPHVNTIWADDAFMALSFLVRMGEATGDAKYFDELLERIREIRLSERRFYQKITDIYATSIDYDKTSKTTLEFFKKVQNKMHYSVTGNTAAEIIYNRADSKKEHMGLTNWEASPNGKIIKSDVVIAKNYFTEEELYSLRRIVSAYLDLAESRAIRHLPMTMEDWANKLDEFLKLTDREILQDAGKISHKIAYDKAITEFEKYRIIQDKLYESDFDKYLIELEKVERSD